MKKIVNLVLGSFATLFVVNCSSCSGSGSYKITFYDDAQNVLETVKVNQGVVPSYSKGVPTKESSESTNYTFNRWIPEIKAATGDASYTASFNAELKKYTVTFDSDGGTTVAPVTVEWGKRISGVTNPSKVDSAEHSYTFAYWYDTTGSADTPFKMSTEIKQNYSLKAKWIEGVKYNTVSFESNGGSYVQSQKVALDGKAIEPDDPVHDSSLTSCYTFDGWYLSPVFLGEKFDFNTAITADTKLYAKWIETVRKYSVDFYFGSTIYETKFVEYNRTVSKPTTNPTTKVEDYGEITFTSWNFDFNNPIIGDTKIYANYDTNYIYYHYTKANSTCTSFGCKEFYGTQNDKVYSMTSPSKHYGEIVEAGAVTKEMIDKIALNDITDQRLIAFAHEFDEITGKCIYNCGMQSITSSVFDMTKLSRTTDYSCELKYGNMYQYNGYAKKIFSPYPLEGLTQIRFYLANPDAGNTFILKGDNTGCVGGVYGGPNTFDGIIATRNGNNWVVTRESGKTMFNLPSWANVPSYTVENPTTINEIFDTYTAASTVYISDIIVEGTPSVQKEIINNAYYVGKIDTKTYSLTNTGEKITGLGSKYIYKCLYGDTTTETAFRELFNDIDISSYKSISFYIDLNQNKYLTFVDDNGSDASDSGAYGLHGQDGAHVPGVITATNEGNGTWKVSASGCQFRKVSDGTKTSEFTYHNRNTLKELFKIGTANSWQEKAMYVSDVVALK